MSNLIRTPEQAESRKTQIEDDWFFRHLKSCRAEITAYQKSTIDRQSAIIAEGTPKYTNTTDSNLDFRERANKIEWQDNSMERSKFGWSLKAIVHWEFFEKDFKTKFKTDLYWSQKKIAGKTLSYFKKEEIKRLEKVAWALETCLDRCGEFAEHVTLCNYLEFLKEYKESDSIKKVKHKHPVIDKTKYDSNKIFNTFFKGTIAFCSLECFNNWFVTGYIDESITFLLKGRKDSVTKQPTMAKAQLISFIVAITGASILEKKLSYYTMVFGKDGDVKGSTSSGLNSNLSKLLKDCEL